MIATMVQIQTGRIYCTVCGQEIEDGQPVKRIIDQLVTLAAIHPTCKWSKGNHPAQPGGRAD